MEGAEGRASLLRQELKAWEKQFALANGGKAPGREHIKKEPAIAAKYREYNKLRDILSGKTTHTQPDTPAGNRPTDAPYGKVQDRHMVVTPKKPKIKLKQGLLSPESEGNHVVVENTRQFVEPTPQKDGRVLGLFDFSPTQATSPIKPREALAILVETLQQTPSRRSKRNLESQDTEVDAVQCTPTTAHRHSRTPQSSSKRFLLDSFVTPSKRRRLSDAAPTPTSGAKNVGSSTPMFLNRYGVNLSTLATVAEDISSPSRNERRRSAPTIPRPRKGITRSLSTMIAEIRQNLDDRLDEEMDILREIENENEARAHRSSTKPANVLVENSQAANILGPDGTHEIEQEDDLSKEGLDKTGKPLRIWKKRGQKRQTRKVNLKPRVRPAATSTQSMNNVNEEDASDSEAEEPEPIVNKSNAEHSDSEFENDSDAGIDRLDTRDDASAPKRTDRQASDPTVRPSAHAVVRPISTQTTALKVVKKISSTANANFRKLKIKSSKGAKGAVNRGRFGRRR